MRAFVALIALLLASCGPFGYYLEHGRYPETAAEREASERRQAEERKRSEEYAAFAQAARAVDILDAGQIQGSYTVRGFVSFDAEPGDAANATWSLQIQALQLGGDALVDVKHELMEVGRATRTSSRGSAGGGAYFAAASGSGEAETVVRNVEHWTAKVIARPGHEITRP